MKSRIRNVALILLFLALIGTFFACKSANVSVSFDTNGGESIPAIEMKRGEVLVQSAIPITSKEGYLFKDWFLDKHLQSRLTYPYVMKASITLYAQWIDESDSSYVSLLEGALDTVDIPYLTETNLVLPHLINYENLNVDLTWVSNNPSYLSNEGVISPSYNDVSVILTATAKCEGFAFSVSRDFVVVVVNNFLSKNIDSVKFFVVNVDLDNVNDNLRVYTIASSTEIASKVKITWTSSNNSIINTLNLGTTSQVILNVERPTIDTEVILTATVTYGFSVYSKEFNVNVLGTIFPKNLKDLLLTPPDIISSNIDLPTSFTESTMLFNVSWSSSIPSVLSNTGKITAPSSFTIVTLTATVVYQKDEIYAEKSFEYILNIAESTPRNTLENEINSIAFSLAPTPGTEELLLNATPTIGTTLVWSSNDENYIIIIPDDQGNQKAIITRPVIGGASSNVTLTVNGTRLSETYSKSYTVNVLPQVASTVTRSDRVIYHDVKNGFSGYSSLIDAFFVNNNDYLPYLDFIDVINKSKFYHGMNENFNITENNYTYSNNILTINFPSSLVGKIFTNLKYDDELDALFSGVNSSIYVKLDFNLNRIIFSKYYGLLSLYAFGLEYGQFATIVEAQFNASDIIIDLNKYGIDILTYIGEDASKPKFLVPYYIMNLLIFNEQYYGWYYNETGLYSISPTEFKIGTDIFSKLVVQSSLHSEIENVQLRIERFNFLALFIDYFYGLKESKSLEGYETLLPIKKQLFLETYSDSFLGIMTLIYTIFDEGHSNSPRRSYYEKKEYFEDSNKYGVPVADYYKEGGWAKSYTELSELLEGYFVARFGKNSNPPTLRLIAGSNTAVINYQSFSALNQNALFNALAQIKTASTYSGVRNIILDISLNGGGTVYILQEVLAIIYGGNYIHPINNILFNMQITFEYEFDGLYRNGTKVNTVGITKTSYSSYEYFILVSGLSFSAANALPSGILNNNRNAHIIGQETGGGPFVVQPIILPDGTVVNSTSGVTALSVNSSNYSIMHTNTPSGEYLLPYSEYYVDSRLLSLITASI